MYVGGVFELRDRESWVWIPVWWVCEWVRYRLCEWVVVPIKFPVQDMVGMIRVEW